MRNVAFVLVLFSGVSLAFAQEEIPDSIKTIRFEEVVVTGQFEPQSASKSVYSIRVISMEKIQSKGAVKLQDVLNTELNIRFDQDASLGGSNLSMQGLPGQNVKILIDGMPMIGRQGTSNEININQININSIERIEIIEGPMSIVYGADALAGAINIITKKNSEGKYDFSVKAQEETVGRHYGGKEGIHNESISGGYSWKNFYTRADLGRNYFGGWQGDSTRREKMWQPKTQWLGSAVIGYKNSLSNVYYRLDYLNEDIYNPGNYGQSGNEPGVALDQNYLSNRLQHQLQGSHFFSDQLSLTTALSYTDYSRKTQSVTVNEATGAVRLSLQPGQQDVTHFDGWSTRTTLQYKLSDQIAIQPGIDLNYESGSGGRIKTGTQSIGDYAAFLSAEWSITSKIQIRPGVRFIHNTVYQAPPVIPAVNTKFIINRNQDFRLSYARGFRAPSLRELFFNFFDASHSIMGNPDLKAELSHSFNGSWNWRVVRTGSIHFTTVVGGFYNTIENLIGTTGGSNVVTYINIDKNKSKGITWNNALKGKKWELNLGVGYTGRYNSYYESTSDLDQFLWSPEVISSATYQFTKIGTQLSAYYKLTGATPFYNPLSAGGFELAETPSFHWMDVSIQKHLGKYLALTGGARNLFDVKSITSTSTATGGGHTSGAQKPVGYGRSYYLSISFSINK